MRSGALAGAVAALLALLVLAAAPPAASAAGPLLPLASTPVTGNISGPTVIGIATSHSYFINGSGGPAFAANGTLVGNFTWQGTVTGSNTTGITLTPQNGTIRNATPVQTVLKVANVTETITITVELSSAFGSQNVSTNLTYQIQVVQPYVLTLNLVAGSGTTVLPFNLTIYLDGSPVGTLAVPTILAGHTYTATFDYASTGLSAGAHTFTASLVAQHGLVTFSGGATTYATTFYVPGAPPNYTIWYVAGIVAFFGAVFIFLTRVAARRRGTARK
jgi:hypothetical protein